MTIHLPAHEQEGLLFTDEVKLLFLLLLLLLDQGEPDTLFHGELFGALHAFFQLDRLDFDAELVEVTFGARSVAQVAALLELHNLCVRLLDVEVARGYVRYLDLVSRRWRRFERCIVIGGRGCASILIRIVGRVVTIT